MKLSTQLYMGFAIPALLLLGIGSYAIVSFSRIQSKVETIYDDRIVPLQQLKLISDNYAVLIIDAVNKANDNLLTSQEALSSVERARRLIEEEWETYLNTKLTERERAIASEVERLFDEANQEINQLIVVLQSQNLEQLDQFDGQLYRSIDPVTEKIQELIELQLEVAGQERAEASKIYQNIRLLFFILLGLAVVLASPVGFFLSRKITATLKDTIQTLANTSSEIAAATEEHERIAEHQAVSVQETTATMDELSVSSHQSAKQAEVAAIGAQQAYALTEQGTRAVNDTLEEMFELKENVRAIAHQISQLNEQASQIGNISELVSTIANQTNLLALNAAVEAVHAGEHGKGFSVVASEIRKLADQSKKSVEKISTLVTEIQASVKATMSVADIGQNSVDKGSKIAQNTATTFQEIAQSVQEITLNSQQISHTAQNQAIAIQQVLEAMTQLNQGAVETSSSIAQTKVGTHKLSETAQNLQRMV